MTEHQVQYTFICGCARSGTSTMTELLRSHRRFGFGRERYNFRFRDFRHLSAELFEKERFCRQLEPGDSHHKSICPYYADLYSRFDHCTHLGDKIPSLYQDYDLVRRNFPNCKIIFMLRNVFDVAQSFEGVVDRSRRTPGHPWPTTKNYQSAVENWNNSLEETLKALDKGDILVVEHELLYVDDTFLQVIFEFLGAEPDKSTVAFWNKAKQRRESLEAQRMLKLTSLQKREIMRTAWFDKYQELSAKVQSRP